MMSKRKRVNRYVLSNHTYKRFLNSRSILCCYTCDKALNVGDEIVSAENRHGKSVVRCISCATRIKLI